MGRGHPRQKQLSFDTNRTPKKAPMDGSTSADSQRGATSAPPPDGAEAIMAELWVGFQAIDSHFDTLDTRLNRMNECLDCQATRMDGAKCRTSNVEDGCAVTPKSAWKG
ncbi:hypothetical protein NDU88_002872 [Pleurodeles waltl]|uniref:Uncharacterized protein n=1 Tax=Pleurodeles waltl TaxID=8319 RepID=A0AAV7T3Q7_PLEWA|nr:hypothetical protein NDU88_002872 [Pleurodeles waltl]